MMHLQNLINFLIITHVNMGRISNHTDGTVDRIVDILEGQGEQWLRMSTDYRKHTHASKY